MENTKQEMLDENQALRSRLEEAEEALRAIRSGEVDALVVPGPNGQEVYTLKTADHAYRVLVEEMQEGAVVVSDAGEIVYANMRFADMLNKSLEQVIGSNFVDSIAVEGRLAVEQLLQDARSGRAKAECQMCGAERTTVPVYLTASLFQMEDRPALCIVVTDLTGQKKTEEVLAADKAKDRFLAMLSHELRTPLNPVMATVQLLEMEKSLTPDFRDAVAMIRRNVELEVRLIDDLLDLTKVRQGKVELKCESVDVHAAIKSALEINQNEITAKQISVSLNLWAENRYAWADPARLRQIFWNLLRNAVKFTPESGQITISSRNDDANLKVRVSDSGIGIEAAALAKLFNAFEQANPTITRRFGGLGLGLTISKALAEMHNGTLTAQSDGTNRGAAFTLDLPSIGENPQSHGQRDINYIGKGTTGRILLVEDHADTLRIMVRLLKKLGHDVTTASTIREALELGTSGTYDLLISDLGLPDGNGIDLMTQLHSRHSMKGIALSGFGQEEDLRRSQEAGFAFHLIKPVDFNALQSAIDKLLLRTQRQ